LSRALSPASFSFDDPAQGLTARGAAKLLTGAATAQCEALFAARTLTVKNGEIAGWMLTLAGWYRRRVVRLRGGEKRGLGCGGLGCGGLSAFGATASIPLALGPP
jgi:hypothetical protein